MTIQVSRLPKDDVTNGWSRILPARQPRAPLSGERRFDWVVLGAGYAGLAAARRLARNRPGETVAIVEAGAAGENASGRNSGFAIDLPHNVGSSLAELEGSHRFMRLARMAIDDLDTEIQTNNIACEWSRDGKYHAAVSAKGAAEVLAPFSQELDALDEPYQQIGRDELAHRLGSAHFHSAIYTPGGALMNPAALVRGLADNLPKQVTLFENSPVTMADMGDAIRLETPAGAVTSPHMIMAANGFSEQFGFYPRRFMHLAAHASITRPLTEQEQSAFGAPGPWGLTPANAFAGITMRYTNDRRIVIRQGLSYCPSQRVSDAERAKIAKRHHALFQARFPAIANVGIEHTWTGFVCLSRNSAPGFGRLKPNVWSAVCQNAVGVTKGTFGGILAADLATGRDNPLIADMESLGAPSLLPRRPFLDLGVRVRFALEILRNRHEA